MTPDALGVIRPPVQIDDRMTVRHRLDDGSATDVIGWVTAVTDTAIELSTGGDPRDPARLVRVARDRIVVAKRVPPAKGGRAPSRHTAEEVEWAAVTGWVDRFEPFGDWTLRRGDGFTGRANSCAAFGDPPTSFTDAAATIIDYYRSHSLPVRAQVIAGSATEQRFRDLGWSDTYTPTTVMAIRLVELIADHRRTDTVTITGELTEPWWRAFQQYRPVEQPGAAQRILAGPPPVGLASIDDHDQLVALGRGQVARDWLGLSALWTAPDHRRRGYATIIARELGLWAARHGARNCYLQVASENTGAIDAYRRLGFTPHHQYRYLTPDSPAATATEA